MAMTGSVATTNNQNWAAEGAVPDPDSTVRLGFDTRPKRQRREMDAGQRRFRRQAKL